MTYHNKLMPRCTQHSTQWVIKMPVSGPQEFPALCPIYGCG